MSKDEELLEYLHENANIGLEATKTLSKKLESTDNKIKSNVQKAEEEYKKFIKKCKSLMTGEIKTLKKGNLFSVIMAKMGTNSEFMKDNSDAKLADTLIQGYNMGILDITKKLNKYKGELSNEVEKLAESYKKMMEDGIRDVKGFL